MILKRTRPVPSWIKRSIMRLRTWVFAASHTGEHSRYEIVRGYRHRDSVAYFDDRSNADEWQNDVYQYAERFARENSLSVIFDVGCGSGYKLVKYFRDYETVGFDVELTVSFVKGKFPGHEWQVLDYAQRPPNKPDLVLCADVVEHVLDPDELMNYIFALNPTYTVFSTPDRDVFYSPRDASVFGPPVNPTHVREWNFWEFRDYVSQRFTVIEHLLINRAQSTQMILCKPKTARKTTNVL